MSVGGQRGTSLPYEHLDAELLAAPFALPSARASALVTLDPALREAGTRALWREVERDLLGRFPGVSIDELLLRRDAIWFGDPARAVPLQVTLRRAASRYLETSAERARPRVDADGGEAGARWSWRWLAFALPTDLLIASDGADAEEPALVSPTLQRHLDDHGFAEVHLHLKAAMDFPLLWASLLRTLGDPTSGPDLLASPGADLSEGSGLAPLMLHAAVVRLVLAGWLVEGRGASLREHLDVRFLPAVSRALGGAAATVVCEAANGLAGGRPDTSWGALRGVYSSFLGRAETGERLDPMYAWFPPTERRQADFGFTRAALAHLDGPRPDVLFTRLFWQCVRARVLLYRHVVQRPMTPGLPFFTRTYARLWAARQHVPLPGFVKKAGEFCGPGLRSLEVRIAPEDRTDVLLKAISAIDAAARELPGAPEVGIVFHFSRDRGGQAANGAPAAWGTAGHDDPASAENPSGYRYSGYYERQRVGAMVLADALLGWPDLLWRVRGLDLCTDELGVPTWVLRPLVRHVEAAAREAARHAAHGGRTPGPLRLTVHAGEDYVHLIGGIRRVHECIEVLGLGESSRIGHAVALGVDPEEWAQRTSRLSLPAGERLLDLLWAWRQVVAAPEPLRSWQPWVEQELARVSGRVFGGVWTPHELTEWWRLLHTDDGLRAARFPYGPTPTLASRPAQLVVRWLTDRALFARAHAHEDIHLSREVGLVKGLQAHVRGQMATRGIIVEINPSSNLLIGQLGDLRRHPLWRLCPPDGFPSDAPRVRVAIGSDDPITFATRLPVEYQLLVDALVGAGLGAPDALRWVEDAREAGMSGRFTVPCPGPVMERTRLVHRPPPL